MNPTSNPAPHREDHPEAALARRLRDDAGHLPGASPEFTARLAAALEGVPVPAPAGPQRPSVWALAAALLVGLTLTLALVRDDRTPQLGGGPADTASLAPFQQLRGALDEVAGLHVEAPLRAELAALQRDAVAAGEAMLDRVQRPLRPLLARRAP